MKLKKIEQYLYLIDEEAEIKENDLMIYSKENEKGNKIIAYYPLSTEAKELDLPLLPNPFEDDINNMIQTLLKDKYGVFSTDEEVVKTGKAAFRDGFIEGYKSAQSKQFSLEDISLMGQKYGDYVSSNVASGTLYYMSFSEYYDKFLFSQQLPKEFIPEYYYEGDLGEIEEDSTKLNFKSNHWTKKLKTITNSEGKEVLTGNYKY